MRAAAIAERAGVTAVAIASTGFLAQAHAIGRALGIDHVPVVEYPGTIPMDGEAAIRRKAAEILAPAILEGLLAADGGGGAGTTGAPEAEPGPREVVFSGDFDGVQEFFERRLWSDGLPIVPPVVERVEAFMAHSPRAADEVIGVLAPDYREATVWSVAVGGVMAGCRPEYMPVLVAIVEAIADPEWRIQDAGSTPGWEPLVVLSGPVVARLGLNTGSGLMRVGNRAATTIGRFLRLYMRNVAGLRVPPGTTDKGTIGATFNVALGEDEAAVRGLGWDPFRVDRGLSSADDVVTVQSVVAISPPIYTGGEDPERHLEMLAYFLGTTSGPWVFTALMYRKWSPLLLLSPSAAQVMAGRGQTKDDIRAYLFEHASIEARWLEIYPHYVGAGSSGDLRTFVAEGTAPERWAQSDDPHRRVPVLLGPEWTNIVVGGDPGRNQSRFYINNHEQGFPVSRVVRYRG
jgi:hypothetical protein